MFSSVHEQVAQPHVGKVIGHMVNPYERILVRHIELERITKRANDPHTSGAFPQAHRLHKRPELAHARIGYEVVRMQLLTQACKGVVQRHADRRYAPRCAVGKQKVAPIIKTGPGRDETKAEGAHDWIRGAGAVVEESLTAFGKWSCNFVVCATQLASNDKSWAGFAREIDQVVGCQAFLPQSTDVV